MPQPPALATPRLCHPLGIVGFFLILAAAVITFSWSEHTALWLVIGFFLLLVVIHPLHGVSFLLLVIPFFLGNPYKPYMALLEIFIYGTLAAAVVHPRVRLKKDPFPLKPLVLFYLLSAGLSLPLNIKELYYTLWALPVPELFRQGLSGNPAVPLHSLRVLLNSLSAAGLMVVTYKALDDRPELFITRNLQALTVMAGLISLAGLLLLFQWVPRGRTYLSLSLVGVHQEAITALSFNRQFLAQYLMLSLPGAAYLAWRSLAGREFSWLAAAAVSLALSLVALAASMQRSVYLVAALLAGFLLVGYGWLARVNKKLLALFLGSPLLIAAGLLSLDWLFFDQRFLQRLYFLGQIKDIRPSLWSAAWSMFSFSPFLGIGPGLYYNYFPDFFPGPPGAWEEFNPRRGNAHSIYVQLLAEQGLFGLFFFGWLIAALLTLAFKGLAAETRTAVRPLRFTLAAAVITWLVLGAFHHLSYDLRSLEIFFWIFAAFILAQVRGLPPPLQPGRRGWILIAALLVVAFGFQLQRVAVQPLLDQFQTGFYPWEKDSAGRRFRWMGDRAVAYVGDAAGDLEIECRAPFPEIAKNPQQVRLWIGDRVYRNTLADGDWKTLRLPFPERRQSLVLRLETAYTFNPAQAGQSRDQRDLGLQLREFRWKRLD